MESRFTTQLKLAILTTGYLLAHLIVESICADFDALRFFPETTSDDWAQHSHWLAPSAYLPDSGKLILTIQAFLVRTRHHTILVDTCVGDVFSRFTVFSAKNDNFGRQAKSCVGRRLGDPKF